MGITGAFKAWLSDSTTSAPDHVTAGATTDGPFYRLDGVKIANNKAALKTAPLFTSITVDDTGAYAIASAWTGTDYNGVKTSQICNGWTSNDGSTYFGTSGAETVSDDGWTDAGNSACNFSYALYCFEDD